MDKRVRKEKLYPKNVQTEVAIAATAKLAASIWTQHYTPIIGRAQVQYMLTKFQSTEAIAGQLQEGYQYTLWHTTKPIGYLAFIHKSDCLFISKIYLTLDQRGKGYGKEMIDYACAQAGICKHLTVRLTVNKYNTNSIAFYQKIGFKITREVIFDIGNNYSMDDYEMELQI